MLTTRPQPTASAAAHSQVVGGLVGVIDIGSNSVRLVVFEDGVRSPDYVFNEKTICRLGHGLGETGRLNPEGKASALAAIRRLASLARRMGAHEVIAVGTAALRDADDGPAFRQRIEAEVGLDIRTASGREEARLAASGVLFGWPRAEGLVADLGGASLELSRIRAGVVEGAVSAPSGHLRLIDPGAEQARRAMLALGAAAQPFVDHGGRLILVGGAWRALAKAHMTLTDYPFHVLQGYELDAEEARAHCLWAIEADPTELKKAADVSSSRLASVAAGAVALDRLIELTRPEMVVTSAFGVREGLIFERMPPSLRAEDPLLAAAGGAEARAARSPGFGAELFAWMRPILGTMPDERLRLAEAACLLHDVNWRAHPDYRASACFGSVTRANLGGVGHFGRLFIGATLLHRYKGGDPAAASAIRNLPKDARAAAETIGRAARLGAMLSGSVIGTLGRCPLARDGGTLRLSFSGDAAEFAGERVERRLRALAEAMGLIGEMSVGS